MQYLTGNFCQWFEILRREGYGVKRAKFLALRNVQYEYPLPDWYLEEKGIGITSK